MSLHLGGAVKALAVGLSLPIRPLPTSDRQLGGHVTATSDSGDTGAVQLLFSLLTSHPISLFRPLKLKPQPLSFFG